MPKNQDTEIRCSFCHKSQDEATRLIESNGVFICDSCIEFCNSLLQNDNKNISKNTSGSNIDKLETLPKPRDTALYEIINVYRKILNDPKYMPLITSANDYIGHSKNSAHY
ncbi:MAG: hypothetical protein IJJ40_02695, partial [Clostridia bacterium]|nr:hypothetical protein [Clostridia bacterium]